MALRHAAVFRNPGSYVASPASPSTTLIWRRSTARIVPSLIGSSYVLPVRLSVTDRVCFDTRIVLGNGSRKITGRRHRAANVILPPHGPSHREARCPVPDALSRRRPVGPAVGRSRLSQLPAARHHPRGCRDRGQRRQGHGG